MFENYSPSVQVGHNCNCHTTPDIIPEQHTPAKITRDNLGNITKLQWAPDARFTLNITSDTNISIVEGSQILNRSGLTPENISGYEGLYVYNIVDTICWQYCNGAWVRLPNVVTSNKNSVVITFGNDQAKTKISIKNFRGETIFTDTENGNFVPLTIDDSLASILMQGFYNLDVYQITSTSTKLIRRIPISVSHAQPENKPIVNNSGSCHNNKGFVTDNSLTYKNGVLSVNIAEQCQPGGMLPISGNAVFEYAQPRNLIVDVDLNTKQASISSHDIYNYIMSGGDVLCLVDGLYLEFIEGTAGKVRFNKIILEDNIITSHIVFINSTGFIEYEINKNHIDAAADITELQTTLLNRMDSLDIEHDTDIENMNASINSMQESVSKMQDQIGNLQVTDKIVELYDSYNQLNTSIQGINEELTSKVSENEVTRIVSDAVSDQLTEDKLQDLVNNAVTENMILDGGVIE